jgi:chromate transport protein ChrA
VVQGMMHGVAPVAAGLVLSLAFKTATSKVLRGPLGLVAIATFIVVAYFRLSLPLVLAIMGPIAVAVAAFSARRAPR